MSTGSPDIQPDGQPSRAQRALRKIRTVNRLGLVAGIVGAAGLAVGTTASLGGFTAAITNTGDQVASGDLLMQEQVTPTGGTTTTCLSTGGGAQINLNANGNCGANKFGNLLNTVPGGALSSSVVVITNQGSVPANTFTMGVGACNATGTVPTGATATNVGSDTSGFCGKVDVTIEDDTNAASPQCIYPAGAGACTAQTGESTTALSNAYNLATLATYAPVATPKALTAPIAAGGARTYKFTVQLDSSATNADQAIAATEPITFTFGS